MSGSRALAGLRGLRATRGVPGGGALRIVERNVVVYRRGWLTLLSGFVEPVFYLFSIGVGVGALVGPVPGPAGQPIPYAAFVAPAMLASSAMNGAVYDSTFNIFHKLRYAKVYDAVLASPLSPRDVAVGEVTWALIRGGLYAAAFLAIMTALGLVSSWWALLVVPVAVLIGFAFAGMGIAATTFMRSWQDFELVNLALLPMFLFSATFYPLDVYPEPARTLTQLSPLYHAAALVRALTTGAVVPADLVHVAVLVALGLAGVALAGRRLARLLLR
jgi:lipooligosaccharide transport system permease protein